MERCVCSWSCSRNPLHKQFRAIQWNPAYYHRTNDNRTSHLYRSKSIMQCIGARRLLLKCNACLFHDVGMSIVVWTLQFSYYSGNRRRLFWFCFEEVEYTVNHFNQRKHHKRRRSLRSSSSRVRFHVSTLLCMCCQSAPQQKTTCNMFLWLFLLYMNSFKRLILRVGFESKSLHSCDSKLKYQPSVSRKFASGMVKHWRVEINRRSGV